MLILTAIASWVVIGVLVLRRSQWKEVDNPFRPDPMLEQSYLYQHGITKRQKRVFRHKDTVEQMLDRIYAQAEKDSQPLNPRILKNRRIEISEPPPRPPPPPPIGGSKEVIELLS